MMEQSNTSLKRIVMGRVYTIHTLQRVFNTTVLSVGIFILALYGLGREVWVARVLQNEPSITNFGAVAHFYLSAFMDTRFIVQILSIVAIGAVICLIYNIVRLTKTARTSFSFA